MGILLNPSHLSGKKISGICAAILLNIILQGCSGDTRPSQSAETRTGSNQTVQQKILNTPPTFQNGDVNVAIEISAGTLQKWEYNKQSGRLEQDSLNRAPRVVDYLGYPANYGMIPGTLLPKERGGDGDPLDVIILGAALERGQIIRCKIIGMLYLQDQGEQDNKLIAVPPDTPFYAINSMTQLNNKYNGITDILRIWFTNYKQSGGLEFRGIGDARAAREVLQQAIKSHRKNK